MAAGTAGAAWIAAQTRELLARPGHAWLLQGPSGLGQYRLALDLARAWLCDHPEPQGRLRCLRQLPRHRRAGPYLTCAC